MEIGLIKIKISFWIKVLWDEEVWLLVIEIKNDFSYK